MSASSCWPSKTDLEEALALYTIGENGKRLMENKSPSGLGLGWRICVGIEFHTGMIYAVKAA